MNSRVSRHEPERFFFSRPKKCVRQVKKQRAKKKESKLETEIELINQAKAHACRHLKKKDKLNTKIKHKNPEEHEGKPSLAQTNPLKPGKTQ